MVKLLLVGDVCGELDAMYKKATTVNDKHGPFDAVLCVGEFIGSDESHVAKYLSGEKKGAGALPQQRDTAAVQCQSQHTLWEGGPHLPV